MAVLIEFCNGVAISGTTYEACIGMFPYDSVSMCRVTTSRFLLVVEIAPNAARLMVSLVEVCSPNFDTRDCDMNVR